MDFRGIVVKPKPTGQSHRIEITNTNQAPSRKQAIGPCKRGKNIQPLQSAGKHIATANRGKTYNRRQARENARKASFAFDWLH